MQSIAKEPRDKLRSNSKIYWNILKRKQETKYRGTEITGYKQKTNSKMGALSPNVSVITLNANGLKTPIKSRKSENEWKKLFMRNTL